MLVSMLKKTVPRFVEIKENLIKDTRVINDFNEDIKSTISTIKELQNINTFLSIIDIMNHSNNLIDNIISYQIQMMKEKEERDQKAALHAEELKTNIRILLEVNEDLDDIYNEHVDE